MLPAIFSALGNKAVQTGITGLLGLGQARKGQQQQNEAYRMPSELDIRNPYKKTQDILTGMGDMDTWRNPLLDANAQEGNNMVRSAAMMGQHGGSTANALKMRLKGNQRGDMYSAYNANKNNLASMQMGIDSKVADTTVGYDQARRGHLGRMGEGNAAMGRGMMSDFFKQAGTMNKEDWAGGARQIGGILGQDGLGGLARNAGEGLIGGIGSIGRKIFGK